MTGRGERELSSKAQDLIEVERRSELGKFVANFALPAVPGVTD
jgi:hypothetical protein